MFFLIALAIALIGYSLAFYFAAKNYIQYRFESDVRHVLTSLVAAVEVEETEVKWQPLEHSIDYGDGDAADKIQWVVLGDSMIIERSKTLDERFLERVRKIPLIGLDSQASSNLPKIEKDAPQESSQEGTTFESKTDIQRSPQLSRLEHISPRPLNAPLAESHFEHQDGFYIVIERLTAPAPMRLARELDEFDRVVVVVGRGTEERDLLLNRLLALVTFFPILIWIAAAYLGQWFVKKALDPVSDMASQAHSMNGSNFDSRLQYQDTGDELSELGASFNRLLERQQVSYEQQKSFAGNAAHELRTPITILLGELDVTLRKQRTAEEYRDTLERLRTHSKTLQDIVESLLYVVRSEKEANSISLQPVRFKDWLTKKSAEWKIQYPGRDIEVEVDLFEDLVVQATPTLLSRILDNLVSNGLKYSSAISPLKITSKVIDDSVQIDVQDFGFGMSSQDMQQLSKPFFRSIQARHKGIAGTGLGLSIAYRIVELLQGSIKCTSQIGRGTTFSVKLPIHERSIG